MSATLNLRADFNITVNGVEYAGKHGAATDDEDDYFAVTMSNGNVLPMANQLATGAVRTIWNDANDFPADWSFFFLWADQDFYLQLVGTTGNAVHHQKAKVPMVLWNDEILVAANTTLLVAGATPTMEDIKKILLSNVSGSTMSYIGTLVE